MTIRRTPADFAVEEALTPEFFRGLAPQPGPGPPNAVYRLRKTSLTTPEAIQRFAAALGIRSGTVDYAGLKDKHAQTSQHISVPAPDPDAAARLTPQVSGGGFTAELIGWSALPLAASAIEANRFTIVVRDLSRDAAEEMDGRAAALSAGEHALLFVNYFGDQRFGSARHGEGFAARHLIRGEFEAALRLLIATPARKDSGKRRAFTRLAAGKWGEWKHLASELPRCPERAAIEALATGRDFREAFAALPHGLQHLCIEAFQSHLWNATARAMAEQMSAVSEPALRADDPFGEMLFPLAATVAVDVQSVEFPMLAPATRLAPPWAEAAERVLAAEGIRLDQLRIHGLRRPAFGEALRPLFARAAKFAMSAPESDDLSSRRGRLKRKMLFDLPRGAYATVLLRALGQ